jgi:hypothetical protein
MTCKHHKSSKVELTEFGMMKKMLLLGEEHVGGKSRFVTAWQCDVRQAI